MSKTVLGISAIVPVYRWYPFVLLCHGILAVIMHLIHGTIVMHLIHGIMHNPGDTMRLDMIHLIIHKAVGVVVSAVIAHTCFNQVAPIASAPQNSCDDHQDRETGAIAPVVLPVLPEGLRTVFKGLLIAAGLLDLRFTSGNA